MLDTSNLRYRKIIYNVQGGLRVRTSVQAMDSNTQINLQEINIFFNSMFRFYGNGL